MIATTPSETDIPVCANCGQAARVARQVCTRCGQALGGVLAAFSRRAGGFLLDITFAAGLAGAIIAIAITLFDANVVAIVAVGIGLPLVYSVGLNAVGGTWGKRVLGLRLETEEPFQNIGVANAATRFAVSLGSVLAFGAGYFACQFNENRQTWHDKAAGSFVRDERPESGWHWIPITVAVWIVMPVVVMSLLYL